MGSWIDVVLVFMLVFFIGFGFHEGLVKQLFLFVALYIGTLFASQYYGPVSGFLLRIFTSSSPEVTDVVGFLLLVSTFTVLATWAMWSAYSHTKLPTASIVDNVGGMTLGVIVGLFAISITIMIANYALQMPWPEGSTVKYALRIGVGNSLLQGIFSAPMPIFRSTLQPWLPGNVPFSL